MMKAWAGACFLVTGALVATFALVGFFIGVWARDYVPPAIVMAAAATAVGGAALCLAGWRVGRRIS